MSRFEWFRRGLLWNGREDEVAEVRRDYGDTTGESLALVLL